MSSFTAIAINTIAIVIVVSLFLYYRKTLQKREAENHKRLENAPTQVLSQLNEIMGGRLYLGENSKLITSKMEPSDKDEGVFYFECLCRTKSENWFVMQFNYAPWFKGGADHPKYKEVNYKRVYPIDERDAKSILSQDIELFREYFGEPAIA